MYYTTYDNGVLRGAPYTAAILLPAAASRDEIIAHAGKMFVCPPYMPTTSCTCWHEGIELHPMRHFPIRNGYSFMLIVHRQIRDDFWNDYPIEEEQRDETAASSFLQISAKRAHSEECLDAGAKQSGAQYVNLRRSINEFEVFDTFLLTRSGPGNWAVAFCISLDTGLVGFYDPRPHFVDLL